MSQKKSKYLSENEIVELNDKSIEYWEKRKAQQMWDYMEEAEVKSIEVQQMFRDSQNYLNEQMEFIFDKYRSKYKLSEAEARTLLNNYMDEPTIQELKKALTNSVSSENKEEILKKLDSAAYASRIQRLQEINENIDDLLNTAYAHEQQLNKRHYIDIANKSYTHSMFNIQQLADTGFSFSQIPDNEIEKLLNSKWMGGNYSSRIWNDKEQLAKELKGEILVNIMTGRSVNDVVQSIANRYNVSEYKSRRVLRTETAFVVNEMEAKSYEDCDIDTYVYLATLDLRTSKICRSLDYKRFKVSEREKGVNFPPMHPFCRSTTIANISDEDLKRIKRTYRDKDGHSQNLDEGMSYQEWYEKYVEKDSDWLLEEKKIANSSSDKSQYRRYKDVLGSEVPETFTDFQELKYGPPAPWNGSKQKYRKLNYYGKKVVNEPSITADMKSIESEVSSRLAGLEYRVKGKGSYLRKVDIDLKGSTNYEDIDKVLNETSDIIRYTFLSENDELVNEYFRINDKLLEMGYNIVRVKNFWMDRLNPYNGVNEVFNKNDQLIEVQFHSPKNLEIKERQHKIYELTRTMDEGSEEYAKLISESREIGKGYVVPKNIDRIK